MLIESEKLIDKKLSATIHKLGGWSIKLSAVHITGLPDRLCLLPDGVLFFAEIKTTGKKPTKVQLVVHKKLRAIGFKVFVVQRSEDIITMIDEIIKC